MVPFVMKRALLPSLGLSLALGSTLACGGDSDGGATGTAGTAGTSGTGGSGGGAAGGSGTDATIAFSAKVGGEAFSCTGSFAGLGTTKTTWKPKDFRLFVHDVRLLTKDGAEVPFALTPDGTFQLADVALLDFEDKTGSCSNGTTETHVALTGKAPAGDYTGIKLTLGVPESKNHLDPATQPSPLNLSTLTWGWAAGYKFLRIDGGTDGIPAFNTHIGSTGCKASAGTTTCSNPNRPTITLTDKDPLKSTIVLDLATLVAGVDLSKDAGGAPGCMSDSDDPECGPVFQSLGLDPASGGPASAPQTFLRFE